MSKKETPFWVLTSGKGCLPSGHKVGQITAPSEFIARQRLRKQVGDWEQNFNLEEITK